MEYMLFETTYGSRIWGYSKKTSDEDHFVSAFGHLDTYQPAETMRVGVGGCDVTYEDVRLTLDKLKSGDIVALERVMAPTVSDAAGWAKRLRMIVLANANKTFITSALVSIQRHRDAYSSSIAAKQPDPTILAQAYVAGVFALQLVQRRRPVVRNVNLRKMNPRVLKGLERSLNVQLRNRRLPPKTPKANLYDDYLAAVVAAVPKPEPPPPPTEEPPTGEQQEDQQEKEESPDLWTFAYDPKASSWISVSYAGHTAYPVCADELASWGESAGLVSAAIADLVEEFKAYKANIAPSVTDEIYAFYGVAGDPNQPSGPMRDSSAVPTMQENRQASDSTIEVEPPPGTPGLTYPEPGVARYPIAEDPRYMMEFVWGVIYDVNSGAIWLNTNRYAISPAEKVEMGGSSARVENWQEVVNFCTANLGLPQDLAERVADDVKAYATTIGVWMKV